MHRPIETAAMYAAGRGIKKDQQAAADYFMQSAENGIACAQYNVGIMYERGRFAAVDMEEAVK